MLTVTAPLDRNIRAFERSRVYLEDRHPGKWVLFHYAQLMGVFDTFDAADKVAVTRFGRGPHVIRQVRDTRKYHQHSA